MTTFHSGARTALLFAILLSTAPLTAEPTTAGESISLPGAWLEHVAPTSRELRALATEKSQYIDWESFLGANFGECTLLTRRQAYLGEYFNDKQAYYKRLLGGDYDGEDKYDRALSEIMLQSLRDHRDALTALIDRIEKMPTLEKYRTLKKFYGQSQEHRQLTERMLDRLIQAELNRTIKMFRGGNCPVPPKRLTVPPARD